MSIHKVYKRSQEDLYAKGHGRQGNMMINPNLHHMDIQIVMSNLITATYLMVLSLELWSSYTVWECMWWLHYDVKLSRDHLTFTLCDDAWCHTRHIAIMLPVDGSPMWYMVLHEFINFPSNLLVSYMPCNVDTSVMLIFINDENDDFTQCMWDACTMMYKWSCQFHTICWCMMKWNDIPMFTQWCDAIFVMSYTR